MARKCMITTIDNKFDPFTDYDNWLKYDTDPFVGPNVTALLGRIAKTSEDLPDSLNEMEIERAIDEIISEDVLGIYVKVFDSNEKET